MTKITEKVTLPLGERLHFCLYSIKLRFCKDLIRKEFGRRKQPRSPEKCNTMLGSVTFRSSFPSKFVPLAYR